MAVKKVVAIEISDYGTKICEIAYNKKHPHIYRSAEFKNPEMSVEDGFVIDRVPYVAILKEQLKKAKIRCKDVVFTLASNKVLNREISIPLMKEKLIGEYIESERDSFFPMDTANHVLTYHILETKKEEKQFRAMVFAAPSLLIENYEALASDMAFKIIAIDYNGNSIYQWLSRGKNRKLDFYLQIKERNTMFTILENGTLALQRNMNFGTEMLVQRMMDYNHFLDEVAATTALTDRGYFYPSFVEMDVANQQVNPFGDHELKAKLTDHLRLLVGNISRVLEYYNSKNRTAELKKIYVGGIGARIQGLKELLENEFEGLEFEMLANLPNLNVPRSNRLCRTKSSEFTACIGAAWPTINLLQESEKDKLKKSIVFSVISLIAVICAATLIVWNGITEYKNTLSIREELNAEVAKLSEIEVLEQQYNSAAQTLTEIQAMDQLTYRYNEEWNDIIHNFELELPTNTVITSLASTNSGLTMNITLKTKEEAAKLLIQLKKMPYFTSVTINELTHIVDPDTRIQAVTFSVACAYYEEQTLEAGTEGVNQDGTQAVNEDMTTGVTQDTTQTVIESRPASTNQSDQSANTGNEVNP